jgi:hypothetical protein
MKTASEILREHRIDYRQTQKGKYTTTCPHCAGGYLNVEISADRVVWFCHHCNEGGGDKFEQPDRDSGFGPLKTIYDYTDEAGERLFQVLKFEPINGPKQFRQRTGPDQERWSIKGVRIVPFMLRELLADLASGHIVFVVEGEKDVLTLRRHGVPATCNPMGAGKWWPKFNEIFRGADVVICGDNDGPGRDHVKLVAHNLHGVVRRLRVLELAKFWPTIEESGDVTDWFEADGTVEQLWGFVEQLPDWVPPATNGQGEAPIKAARAPLPPKSIDDTLKVFDKWLILKDATPVLAVLGAVAANYLDGDAIWFGLIAPPSSAKTEILNSVSLLPHVVPAATMTPAGLLSGTPNKQRDKGAKGGLLRQIGDFGIIVLKDFGSILSMHTETRAETMAALREIFDGHWTRVLGTGGGKTLTWAGKVGLVFASTGVIDSYYSVIGAMGDRFLFCRMAPTAGQAQFTRALDHVGATTAQMRKELAEAVAQLFAGRATQPRPISKDEINGIGQAISLVVRLRGAVERDRRTRELEAIYGAEGTARVGLALERLLAGLDTLGVERETAMAVVVSVAMDSAPPLRRRAYECVCRYRNVETADVAIELGLPTVTARRILEDLAAYGLVTRYSQGQGKADLWDKAPWETDQ